MQPMQLHIKVNIGKSFDAGERLISKAIEWQSAVVDIYIYSMVNLLGTQKAWTAPTLLFKSEKGHLVQCL